MKFQRIVFGLFGTFMILFSRSHCYVCDNGQMITAVSHEECFNELSSVVELVCGVMSGVKKRAVSERSNNPFSIVKKRNREKDLLCHCCQEWCSFEDIMRYC
ncbi:uncharacterized protein LOC134686258 [Mytilus trossulus]|uniref:uncharacterized protein LOC134686258 n=1 Tax=Mytilus trossulus TaxID=6551 RepID=UPI00300799E8